jgi:IclR family acetate operon transcriptional repressor
MRNDEHRLHTVDRALTLLSFLNDHSGAHQLRELAAALGMNKAVVYRLLRTMQSHGYVSQDAVTTAYRIGPRARALGRRHDPTDVFAVAREPMRELARTSGLSAFLTLPLVHDSVCVDRAEASTTVRVSYEIGRRLPYHAGAPGKALLASFGAQRRAEALGAGLLTRFTAATIVSRAALEAELARVVHRGYATSAGEIEDDVSGIAAVIFDTTGNAAAALSLSGLSATLREPLFNRLGRQLVAAARAIGTDLGVTDIAVPARTSAVMER